MAIAVVLVLLVIGSLIFHFASPWWFTPIASNWTTMDDTVKLTFWVTGVVFVAVNLFMAWVVCATATARSRTADYEPENKKLEWWLTIVTSVGVAAMLAPGLFVWAKFVDGARGRRDRRGGRPAVALELPLPGRGRRARRQRRRRSSRRTIRSASIRTIPKGSDDVLVASPELHLPVDQPVKVLLRSKDVLHNFTVHAVPREDGPRPRDGHVPVAHADRAGLVRGPLRGTLRRRALRDARPRRRRRRARNSTPGSPRMPTFAQTQALATADAAAGAGAVRACARACHGAYGEGNATLNAPKLAGQEAWYLAPPAARTSGTACAAARRATPSARRWRRSRRCCPTTRRSGNVVAPTSQSLPGTTRRATLTGDVDRGKEPLRHLRQLPWRRRAGRLVDQRAAARRHERLVPGAPAEEFPAWRPRPAPAGLLRLADGGAWRTRSRRASHRRPRRLHQHARSPSRRARPWRTGGTTDGIRRNRGPRCHLHDPQTFITKYIWSQDHKVIAIQYAHRRDRRRPRRARAVGPDAAAARLPRHVPLHQPEPLLPVRHHARDDHGDLPADRAVPRRLRQLPDPAHVSARGTWCSRT